MRFLTFSVSSTQIFWLFVLLVGPRGALEHKSSRRFSTGTLSNTNPTSNFASSKNTSNSQRTGDSLAKMFWWIPWTIRPLIVLRIMVFWVKFCLWQVCKESWRRIIRLGACFNFFMFDKFGDLSSLTQIQIQEPEKNERSVKNSPKEKQYRPPARNNPGK